MCISKPEIILNLFFSQIGYSTSSPQFSDKEKFPLYFRTSTSETMENPSRVALLRHFKWKKVGLIVQNLDIYVLVRYMKYQYFFNYLMDVNT